MKLLLQEMEEGIRYATHSHSKYQLVLLCYSYSCCFRQYPYLADHVWHALRRVVIYRPYLIGYEGHCVELSSTHRKASDTIDCNVIMYTLHVREMKCDIITLMNNYS